MEQNRRIVPCEKNTIIWTILLIRPAKKTSSVHASECLTWFGNETASSPPCNGRPWSRATWQCAGAWRIQSCAFVIVFACRKKRLRTCKRFCPTRPGTVIFSPSTVVKFTLTLYKIKGTVKFWGIPKHIAGQIKWSVSNKFLAKTYVTSEVRK